MTVLVVPADAHVGLAADPSVLAEPGAVALDDAVILLAAGLGSDRVHHLSLRRVLHVRNVHDTGDDVKGLCHLSEYTARAAVSEGNADV